MITGHLGVACAGCGNTGDPLGVMVDSTGRLVCFWCQAPDRPAPPVELVPAWIVGDYDVTDITCEQHAKEYAADNGLVWEYPGSTLESPNGYAYAVAYSGDLESDYPHVCGVCGVHVDTALTNDGVEYVREHYAPEWWHLWGIDA